MNIRRQFRTFERLARWWWVRFTPGGKAVSLLALYSVPAIVTFNDALPYVGICAFMVLILTAILSRVFRPRASVECRVPRFATVSQEVTANVHVENLARQPALDLSVRGETRSVPFQVRQPLTGFSLQPRERRAVTVGLTPERRGRLAVPAVYLRSTFPLNLLRTRIAKAQSGSIDVLPRALPLAVTSHEGVSRLLGIEQRVLAVAGNGYEYIGSREYMGGPVRRWDYASWARLGLPVVREFAQDADRQVSVAVDLSHPGSKRFTRRDPQLESYLTAVFSVVEHLLGDEIEIALFAIGDAITRDLARAGNHGHDQIRSLFAAVDPKKRGDLRNHIELLQSATQGSALVFLREWNQRSIELVDRLRGSNPVVRPILFQHEGSDRSSPAGNALEMAVTDRGVTLR